MKILTGISAAFLFVGMISARCAAAEFKDVEYREAAGVHLLLDAQIPDGEGPFPAAILVHGGG